MKNKRESVFKTCGIHEIDFQNFKDETNFKGQQVRFSEVDSIGTIKVKQRGSSESKYLEVIKIINDYFIDNIYSTQDKTIEDVVISMMVKKVFRVSVAESITCGEISSKLGNIDGCSKVLFESIVCYDKLSKINRLGVSEMTIKENGTVSQATLSEMLDGLSKNEDIEFAVATTGCAAECNENKLLPKGLVYIGVSNKKNKVISKLIFRGDRNKIRRSAANYALFILYTLVKKEK